MIIATAGHVDHGKTTLLQAITGVNADRLPEEKKARHDHRSRLCLLAAAGRADTGIYRCTRTRKVSV
ncbi:Selenocysteine-specific translation elongation factor [Citrobacter freundii]|uniref:Selenocysteine-specific translation elongation factor n=1 Tax=Citrobacter freundii TaxID=546 RepID=A0A7G2IUL7_CITFR|nr:Selenocysteine-specific translation elongation factor [Citrobacter freundii]